MADTWSIDLGHYLDRDGNLGTTHGPAMAVALHAGSIAAWVTREARPGRNGRTNVPCRRSPGRRRCLGEIRAAFGGRPGEILWACPVCGDRGVIRGFRDTRWDRSPAAHEPMRDDPGPDAPFREPTDPHPEAGFWPLRVCRGEAGPPADTLEDENSKLLEEFERKLESSGLPPETVDAHVENVEFFVNVFLQGEAPTLAVEGVARVGEFLGDWFIRKAPWASPASLRETAVSLKQYYAHLHETGRVDGGDLAELLRRVKTDMDLWLDRVREFHGERDGDSRPS